MLLPRICNEMHGQQNIKKDKTHFIDVHMLVCYICFNACIWNI